ncbi:Endonuclease V [hydrothermal vent metagenome]|uniref:Endonuclease V n=1 Tax=hydrothermal vent metagenome TaxID=652676 RepID=A0A3B1CRK2_9ZZZZ
MLTAKKAANLQLQMRGLVITEPVCNFNPCYIAGVDVSVRNGESRAAVVTVDIKGLLPVETATAAMPVSFPYVPGLLAFREAPVILEAFSRLKSRPDILIVDGQGMAHPRRFGLACHLGVELDIPSIGCAKSRLVGSHDEPKDIKGASTALIYKNEVTGKVLRTRKGVKPVYISIGHRVDLATAVDIIIRCVTRYRLPEPIRQAHKTAGEKA